MKVISKAVIVSFLVVLLAACNAFTAKPAGTPIPTATGLPASTPTPEPAATPTPVPTGLPTPLLPTQTLFLPTMTPSPYLPISMGRTTVVMDNGLTWTECAVPNREYSHTRADIEFISKCADIPQWDANDKIRAGERVDVQNGFSDFRITIGSDHFETKLADTSQGCCNYELIKNGEVLLKINPGFWTYDPNINFWNFEGKLVWELSGSFTSVIIVDGVNFNEKYQLEGSYFPYEINGKLIYIAKQNGKFHIVYDEKTTGPAFDEISMAYCCAMVSVNYGNGQYWFVGRRAETKFIVSIH
jgi:hypothetical protein